MLRSTAILTVLTLGLAACHDDPKPRGEPVPQGDAERILESTPWLDTAPQDERDVIHAYVFQRGEGLYYVGNAFKATLEMIRYWIDGDTLKLRFLDEDKSYETKYTIEKWRGEIFDYKLTLKKDPRGPKVYYGFDHGRSLPGWVSKIKVLTATP